MPLTKSVANRKAKSPSLNIKNPETYKLAKELASQTGESLTTAVEVALRERLAAVRRKRRQELADLIAFAREGARLFPGPYEDPAAFLYDENGLPK